MTAQDFNRIKNLNDKANIVWDCSRHVDERIIYNEYKIQMYALYGFYVEVWIAIKTNKIEKIKALEGETNWKGYLISIRMEDLY